ncbi:hypothetical protein Tamer19_67150 [Cupriavidus sp. TA19]|nr:hypothetical protein Tamer19_67150 [Cupriavidus sp. TA19]
MQGARRRDAGMSHGLKMEGELPTSAVLMDVRAWMRLRVYFFLAYQPGVRFCVKIWPLSILLWNADEVRHGSSATQSPAASAASVH